MQNRAEGPLAYRMRQQVLRDLHCFPGQLQTFRREAHLKSGPACFGT